MLENNVIIWTSKIMDNARKGLYDRALACFLKMLQAGVEPNAITYSTTISVCGQFVAPSFGMSLHCLVLKKGYLRQLFVSSGLVTMYSKCDNIKEARRVFDDMAERDSVSWNSMIAGFSQKGFHMEACSLFCCMMNECKDWNLFVNSFTLASVLKACSGLGCVRIGKSVHCCAIKLGFDSDIFVGGAIIDMYSKCGFLNIAYCVFDRLESRDIVVWNAMIVGYAQSDYEEEAINLFYQLQNEGFRANEITYSCVLKASTVMSDCTMGRCLHAKTLKSGILYDIYVGTALVDMYSKFYEMEDAQKAFHEMKKTNLVSFNALITGYSLAGRYQEALIAYLDLQNKGIKPDSFTFIGIFSACSVSGAVTEGAQVHAHSFMYGLDLDVTVGNSIMNFYSKCGLLDDALKAFDFICTPNAISWAGIIAGLAQNGEGERALKQFCKMHKLFGRTDEFSCSSVLKSVASWVTVEQGRHFHAHAIKSGLKCTIFVGSALVDMYSKCGIAEEAYKVFYEMPKKNVVTWNSMITGYAQNGYCKEALHLFQEMTNSRILPTSVTFAGVLFACSHAGLVEEGRNYYHSMVYGYGISPSVEHCTCMVNLLGRAGYLNEAETFLLNCPFSEKPAIWGSLLASCEIHKNSDVGWRAAQRYLWLKPYDSSVYTILSNIYASKGLWFEVTRVRDIMKEMGIEKEPGCSWIEVKSRNSFVAGEKSHSS